MGYAPGGHACNCRDKATRTFFNSCDIIFDESFTGHPFPTDSNDSDDENTVRNHNSVGMKRPYLHELSIDHLHYGVALTLLCIAHQRHMLSCTFPRLRLLTPALSARSHALLPIIQEDQSMSEHPFGTSYSMLHKCNKDCSTITCHYILLCMFSLSLPCPMRS
jgi:hypothetical protein